MLIPSAQVLFYSFFCIMDCCPKIRIETRLLSVFSSCHVVVSAAAAVFVAMETGDTAPASESFWQGASKHLDIDMNLGE